MNTQFIYQSADDSPFIENSKIDDRTIDGNIVLGKLESWYFKKAYVHRDQEVPIADFLAAFTRLIKLQPIFIAWRWIIF